MFGKGWEARTAITLFLARGTAAEGRERATPKQAGCLRTKHPTGAEESKGARRPGDRDGSRH
jgi:hypothetical protein